MSSSSDSDNITTPPPPSSKKRKPKASLSSSSSFKKHRQQQRKEKQEANDDDDDDDVDAVASAMIAKQTTKTYTVPNGAECCVQITNPALFVSALQGSRTITLTDNNETINVVIVSPTISHTQQISTIANTNALEPNDYLRSPQFQGLVIVNENTQGVFFSKIAAEVLVAPVLHALEEDEEEEEKKDKEGHRKEEENESKVPTHTQLAPYIWTIAVAEMLKVIDFVGASHPIFLYQLKTKSGRLQIAPCTNIGRAVDLVLYDTLPITTNLNIPKLQFILKLAMGGSRLNKVLKDLSGSSSVKSKSDSSSSSSTKEKKYLQLSFYTRKHVDSIHTKKVRSHVVMACKPFMSTFRAMFHPMATLQEDRFLEVNLASDADRARHEEDEEEDEENLANLPFEEELDRHTELLINMGLLASFVNSIPEPCKNITIQVVDGQDLLCCISIVPNQFFETCIFAVQNFADNDSADVETARLDCVFPTKKKLN